MSKHLQIYTFEVFKT